MVGLADQNGKTYECFYGTYNKADGFRFNESVEPTVDEYGWREVVNILFHEDIWKLKKNPVKQMTLEEIEKALGYKVELVKKENKETEETVNIRDLFKDIFGFDIMTNEDNK